MIYLSAWVILLAIAFSLYEPKREAVDSRLNSADSTKAKLPIEVLAMIYAITLFYMVTFYAIPVQLPFYLQDISNASASASGLAIASPTLASSIASLRYGFVTKQRSLVSVVIVAFAIAAVGYFIIGFANSYNVVLIGLIIAGLGVGLVMPNLNIWLSSLVDNRSRGKALGGLTTSFFLGQFLSPIVSQPITNAVGLGKTYFLIGVALLAMSGIFLALKKQVKIMCQEC